jgi:hypothetical protein
MKNPQLQVVANSGPVPVEAVCSLCPNVKFTVKVPELLDAKEAMNSLERQFKTHVAQVHKQADSSHTDAG